MIRVGAHVSTAGGIDKAIVRASDLTADTIQIFGSPPQSWRTTKATDEQITLFKNEAVDLGIEPVFIHGTYLVNLATENDHSLKLSIDSLIDDLRLAKRIDSTGVIFHLGSHKGKGLNSVITQVTKACQRVLEATDGDQTWLIFENSAGMGGALGSKFEELAAIINAIASKRVKVCLDTQHTFAAGYPIHQKDGIETTLDKFDAIIGLDKLVVIHANDSKVPFMAGRDRHENIGQGYIGKEGFGIIINNKSLFKLPFIIETPGFDNTGPDRKNIEILRKLAQDG